MDNDDDCGATNCDATAGDTAINRYRRLPASCALAPGKREPLARPAATRKEMPSASTTQIAAAPSCAVSLNGFPLRPIPPLQLRPAGGVKTTVVAFFPAHSRQVAQHTNSDPLALGGAQLSKLRSDMVQERLFAQHFLETGTLVFVERLQELIAVFQLQLA